jgi:hypothetical protein
MPRRILEGGTPECVGWIFVGGVYLYRGLGEFGVRVRPKRGCSGARRRSSSARKSRRSLGEPVGCAGDGAEAAEVGYVGGVGGGGDGEEVVVGLVYCRVGVGGGVGV